jgi:hypothetical protein
LIADDEAELLACLAWDPVFNQCAKNHPANQAWLDLGCSVVQLNGEPLTMSLVLFCQQIQITGA